MSGEGLVLFWLFGFSKIKSAQNDDAVTLGTKLFTNHNIMLRIREEFSGTSNGKEGKFGNGRLLDQHAAPTCFLACVRAFLVRGPDHIAS